MMNKMKSQSQTPLIFFSFLFFFFFYGSIFSVGHDEPTLADKCSKEFTKVTQCLNFATAKAPTPTKECCESVKEIRDSDPACLCYFIQQTHNNASEQIKSLGIQEARLLQLPSACQISGSNITECPKLLGLAPGSADYNLFTNASSIVPTTTPATGTSQADDPNGAMHLPHLSGPLVMVVAFFAYAFPGWICLYI